MSSVTSDATHKLIHSLSASEKRYFRLYLSKGEGQKAEKYNRLFEMLLKQKIYKPEPLMAAFGENKARLAVSRNYLFRLVLKAMRAYSAEKNLRRQIKGLMSDGIFLYEKTLFVESEKVFKKAWKLAEQCEDRLTLLEVLVWERRLLKLTEKENRRERMNAAIATKDMHFKQLETEFAYQDLADQVYLMGENKVGLSDDEMKNLQGHPLLSIVPSGMHAAKFYYRTKIGIMDLLGQDVKAHALGCEALSFWEERPFLQQDDPVEFQSQYSNLMHLCSRNEMYETIPLLLERLNTLPVASDREQLFKEQSMLLFELIYALNTGDHSRMALEASKRNNWLDKNGGKLHPGRFLVLLVNMAIFEFMQGNFSAALKCINQLLDAKRLQVRQDIQQMARLLELVIFFEKKEFELLPHRIRSAGYFFGKMEASPFNSSCLRFFRELLNVTEVDKKKVLKTWLEELQGFEAVPPPGSLLGLAEVRVWVTAQLKQRTMFDVVREEYRV